jgi:glutamyl-tRNA reductase
MRLEKAEVPKVEKIIEEEIEKLDKELRKSNIV